MADYIDGLSGDAGLYMVADTTAPGPHAVTEQIYNLDSGVAASFGIPGAKLGEDSLLSDQHCGDGPLAARHY